MVWGVCRVGECAEVGEVVVASGRGGERRAREGGTQTHGNE